MYRTLCRSCSHKGKTITDEAKRKIGEGNKGKTHTDESKRKMRDAHKGDKSHFWKGGISFEPYCIKFNAAYKRMIRERFNNVCFLCGKWEKDNGRALDVHHVNYNKDCGCDGSMCICVPLCRSCHTKTNSNREYWERKIIKLL